MLWSLSYFYSVYIQDKSQEKKWKNRKNFS